MPRFRAVALVALGVVLAGCGGVRESSPGLAATKSLFGPFAGYNWTGHVRSVSAVVVVPRLAAVSSGYAGTWIGARGKLDLKTLSAPFFQIGVNEFRLRTPHHGARTLYYAFWSSTGLGFHPRNLFSVNPGDQVRLSMVLADGRWRMVATDATTGESRTVTARSGASFTLASWLQEDVAANASGALAAYPQLGTPRFASVRVNSARPAQGSMKAGWMSSQRGTFGPTPFSAGGFSVTPVHPSPTGRQYQQIVLRFGYSSIAFEHDLAIWTPHTHRAAIRAASTQQARVVEQVVSGLEAHRWPSDVGSLVRHLVVALRRQRTVVLALGAVSASGLGEGKPAYRASVRQVQRIGLKIISRLHIARGAYSGAALSTYVHSQSEH